MKITRIALPAILGAVTACAGEIAVRVVRVELTRGGETALIQVVNQGTSPVAGRVVVYASNDEISPPQREVWPAFCAVILSKRGQLSIGRFATLWGELKHEERGYPITVQPGGVSQTQATLPWRATSPHEAWRGAAVQPGAFRSWSVWLLNEEGQVLAEGRLP